MKNENVHMQALYCKIHVVLVQILCYNCSETEYSFCQDSPPAGLRPLPDVGFTPSDSFTPTIFFRSAAPAIWRCTLEKSYQESNAHTDIMLYEVYEIVFFWLQAHWQCYQHVNWVEPSNFNTILHNICAIFKLQTYTRILLVVWHLNFYCSM